MDAHFQKFADTIPTEILEQFKNVISDKVEVSKIVKHCYSELSKIDRFFDWGPIFQNMINLGIIDEDENTKTYRSGLIDFHKRMLDNVRELDGVDLSFLEGDGDFDRTLFNDNMLIGSMLLNDVQCFEKNESEIIKKIGGCFLMKHKHEHSYQKMCELGDSTQLFADPPDLREGTEE